jgi:hypothetical protein
MTDTARPFPRVPSLARGRGRPAVGSRLPVRLPAELRDALEAARRTTGRPPRRESAASAARRLLAVALDPILPGALALAAAAWDDDSSAECEACAAEYGGLCARHARSADLADAARRLAVELAAAPGAERLADDPGPVAPSPWGHPEPPRADDPDEPTTREIEPDPPDWHDGPDAPDPEDHDPGPEVDDEGGMSEYRHAPHEPEPWS